MANGCGVGAHQQLRSGLWRVASVDDGVVMCAAVSVRRRKVDCSVSWLRSWVRYMGVGGSCFLVILALVVGKGGRVVGLVDSSRVARRGELLRVVHMVCRGSVMVRQGAFGAWIPPERGALNGRRSLDGDNYCRGGPLGLRLSGKDVNAKSKAACAAAVEVANSSRSGEAAFARW